MGALRFEHGQGVHTVSDQNIWEEMGHLLRLGGRKEDKQSTTKYPGAPSFTGQRKITENITGR